MDAIRNAVQIGIEQLSRPAVAMNSHPGDGYAFQARTAAELKESAHLVPKVNPALLPPPEDEPAAPPRPAPARPSPKAAGGGWLL